MSVKRYRMIIFCSAATTLLVSTVALSQSFDEPICYLEERSGDIRDLSNLCGVDSGQAGDSPQQTVHGQPHFEIEIFESDSNGESYTRVEAESLESSDDPQQIAFGNYVNELEQACAGSDRCSTNAGLARVTQEICDNPGDCPHYILVEPYENSELEDSEE
ncbi:MAG: hypothetical protein HC840_09460 [Leptolyngbyaceae cyanobacterium RM2_2_4]|nr:hypothetical protein [Leptolyngbyaceae cyanobacterium SM1_4_3]NJO49625.1 hypothetical protein [Leptolyngbyaceae cyanobacterium RM2_2_4]